MYKNSGYVGVKTLPRFLLLWAAVLSLILPQLLFIYSPVSAASASVSNETELNTALSDGSIDTINFISDFATTGEVSINRSVTIEGNGYTISPTFPFVSNAGDNSVIEIIGTSGVTINNLHIDGTGGTDIHGVNIYESTGILLDRLISENNDKSGVVVNGSTVTVDDIETHNNTWHGINVAQGSGVTDPADLTLNGISIHSDLAPIYMDDTTQTVSLTDTNSQYSITEPVILQNDRLYTLDPERFAYLQGNNLKIDICHATASNNNPYVSNSVDLDGLNGHGDHDGDIIPPNPDIPNGINWTRENIDIWENECEVGEEPPEPCEEGPAWAAFVEDSDQGTTKGGGAVAAARSDTDHALGAPDATTNPVDGFYSLGVEGEITVSFAGPVINVDGDDLSFHEVTNGRTTYPEEVLDVEVSQDGSSWHSAGSVTNKDGGDGVGFIDFESTGLDWIQYVKVTDATDYSLHNNSADGYDLDAIDATYQICPEEEPCEVGTLWQIGDDEASQLDAPQDELSWNGAFGDWSLPMDDPFWVGVSPDSHFPWNSNHNQGQATDFDVNFFYGGEDAYEAKLTVAWGPGRSASETKEIYLNGAFEGASSYIGSSVAGWYESMEIYDDMFSFPLDHGFNSINFKHLEGDGTLWDFVRLDIVQCDEEDDDITVVAHKVVCVAEEYLPNWGNGRNDANQFVQPITADTAQDWVDQSQGNCELSEWDFQLSVNSSPGNPGDNTGEAGDPWKTFSSEISFEIEDVSGDRVWAREVWEDGWVEFTGVSQSEDVSAEFYCHNDVLHYDNYDYINGLEEGETYYCVGFNAPPVDEGVIQGRKFHDLNANGVFNRQTEGGQNRLNGWLISLYDDEWNLLKEMETGDDGTEAGNVGRGQYRFVGLAPGTYYVCETMQDGWVQTLPNVGEQHEDGPYCFTVVLENHDDRVTGLRFGNYEAIGQIQGLVYNDTDNNEIQDAQDEGLESWGVILLTKNSPYTVQAIDSTSATTGDYLFENLAFGTYYVCQDVQSGWLQTQLNNAGNGGATVAGVNVGDVLELDDTVVTNSCYVVVLDPNNPTSVDNDFGNFFPVLGTSTTGQVLGTSTEGEVLAETGSPAWLPMAMGGLTVIIAGALAIRSRKSVTFTL